ncbi:hypothetical protein SO802_006510 [Lithocarpus litseifolius]|uniref:RNase H type-1 domain-containing protein n=1 Tax=Lithocarpus litseifolius TaxID=425828 RepID=A0AAW2DNM4_9ROSI
MFKEQRMAGVGILIRDAEGHLIGACSKKLAAPLGAIEAEAKAVELGLLFAQDMSIQDFTLESDSLTCVDFSHVSRNGNRPAHILARHALGIAELSVWVEEVPCFLEQALNQDVVAISSD